MSWISQSIQKSKRTFANAREKVVQMKDNKVRALELEAESIEKEARIRENYEKARLRLDKAKRMRTARIMSPLRNVAQKTSKRVSSIKGKAKQNGWEPKSLL